MKENIVLIIDGAFVFKINQQKTGQGKGTKSESVIFSLEFHSYDKHSPIDFTVVVHIFRIE